MKVNLKDNKENRNVTTYRNAKEVVISFADKVFYTNMKTSTLFWVFKNISQTTWKRKIEEIRNEEDEEKRKQLKFDTLGYFNIGEFRSNKRNNKSLISTEFMLFDFDHLGDGLKAKTEILKASPDVYALFLSPSGDGLKVIYRLDAPITNKNLFSEIYKVQAKILGASLGSDADKTSDASRPCFFSYDPDIYINENALPLKIGELKKKISKPGNKKDKPDKQNKKEKSADRDEILATLDGVKEGSRNTALTQLVGMYISKGFDIDFTKASASGWNLKNDPPLPQDEIDKTVENLYSSYAEENRPPSSLVHYKEENNRYVKLMKEEEREISSFILEPKELLILNDSDCLKVKVITDKGYEYDNILLENTDWHTKGKFLKALGHQDCVFLGSENDLLGLCNYLNARVERRITGTKVIGLHEGSIWVTENQNITKAGTVAEQRIVPYAKGGDAFYHKIQYAELNPEEIRSLIKGIYSNITMINTPETILPWIGWVFASPMKPVLRTLAGGFPLMFVHGGQGSGKTSTAGMLMRLLGYNDPKPFSCTMRPFPMLKLLSSTNAIPVILDEFKKSDMAKDQVDELLRYMRKAYSGEVESKGRPDQTVDDYMLDAPVAVMGEWDINQPALKERVLIARFTNMVKENREMQNSFSVIKQLPLEGFMPEYVKFCLNQDIAGLFKDAEAAVGKYFNDVAVAPRVLNNLSIMLVGLKLFALFGEEHGFEEILYDEEQLLKIQLKEITGTEGGLVKSAVDQIIEEFSIMAQRFELLKGNEFKIAEVKDTDVIAIRFDIAYSSFKEYARKTGYEGDQLDKNSYMRLFDDCSYIVSKNHPVKFGAKSFRCLCIDYEKAKSLGINIEGFVFDSNEQQ